MGKAKKMKLSKPAGRNPPLAEQIIERDLAKPVRQQKQSQTRHRDNDEVLDKSLTKKILDQAKSQQAELEEDFGVVGEKKNNDRVGAEKPSAMDTASRLSEDESASEQSDEEDETYYEHIECDEEDEKAMSLFMSKDPPTRKTLGDIIMEKISEKKTELMSQMSDVNSVQMQPLDDRIVQMYRGVRDILSKYRSGKLPKAFKIIPSLANWEQILYLTEPDNWTAAAMYQATRIFTSNLNAKMAQRFFNLVLLPRIRDDICEYKKLNPHLYMALKKSLFKPAAFFKGILLPLCESGTCTLREAIIIASVLAKCSVPVLHASAAILKVAEMDYTGANSIFLRTLFDKKYALPYRVIDAVVFHYLRFRSDKRQLPVLWHQSLLSFAQRYKEDISSEQKESLLELLHHQSHELITPEIRRELTHSKSRGEEATSVEAMQQV